MVCYVGNVWASSVLKEVEFANDGSIVKCAVKRFAVWGRAYCCTGGCRSFLGRKVAEVECVDDLVDEVWLRHVDGAIGVLFNFHS